MHVRLEVPVRMFACESGEAMFTCLHVRLEGHFYIFTPVKTQTKHLFPLQKTEKMTT